MTLFQLIITVIGVCILTAFLRQGIIKIKIIRGYRSTLRDFMESYFVLEKVLSEDLEASEILKECDLPYNLLKIGSLNEMMFQDSEGVRQCMLLAGEFILKYAEIINNYYGYEYETEDYTTALEMLKNVRRICLTKGEIGRAHV